MSDFVHLHLHTEFSLLDGACRIDELLDQATALNMSAIGVTEHGNLFSSVIFHDHARARGLKPILGCEVYVAPGSRLTKSGNPGETANHLILLAETRQAARDKTADDLTEKHREHMEESAERRVAALKQETDKLEALLQSNTSLTQQDKELTEQVAALTREIHAAVTKSS